ncbi:carcinoembryonic antigen-related cell adhesion molecule 21-like [Artibeus jamaicensis]|uniref:carcinoembryonic antigen-related cell adhesion molecule 21-like n=1 Tax=Artibeus jamaicensis TaxID=9417 RepID=UPI00235A9E11|nr:carcinoembryonic antigen-related cell adhesion molecule 21-like [Artibeus jamaicensis]
MGSPSVSTHRGLVHWQGLLLVVSLLNFWSQPTTAQVTVESTNALEGTDVTLRIHHTAPNTAGFLWYRGDTTDSNHIIAYLIEDQTIHVRGPPGGQVIVNYNGSLVLKNVTMKDAGIYTVLVQLQGCQKMIACGRLTVYPLLSAPTLTASNTTVTENQDVVVFTCYTDTPGIQWLFNGTNLQLTKRMKLSLDHRNLTIDPVQREDDGDYWCKGFNLRSSGKSNKLKLDVKYQ